MEELRKPRISFVISQNVHGGAQEVKNIVCNIPECARRSSGSQEYYYPRILLSQNVQGGAQEANQDNQPTNDSRIFKYKSSIYSRFFCKLNKYH